MLEADFGSSSPRLPRLDPQIRIMLLKAIDPKAGMKLEADEQLKRQTFSASLTLDGTTRLQDLPQLSPLGLLQQLVLVCRRFPENKMDSTGLSQDEYEQLRKTREQRVSSDEFRETAIWLEGLLNVSPTTCGFDFSLMRACRDGYSLGVNRQVTNDPLGLIIESRLADDGAFFNPNHSKEYEKTHYKRLIENHTETMTMIDSFLGLDNQRLADNDLTDAEIDRKFEEMNAFAGEIAGHPVDMEKIFLMMKVGDRIENRRWIDEFDSIYMKGPRLEEPHARIPSQQRTEVELILARWRRDFLAKYNDEP